MQILGFVYLAAGCVLSILVLRIAHGQWADFRELATTAAVVNGFTGVFAIVLFRRTARGSDFSSERIITPDSSTTGHRVLLIACYLIGIAAGIYFYYT